MRFDEDLHACLSLMLGAPPPLPEDDPLLFYKQWLAERNLGLVPIANAREFAWPGSWLARVSTSDGDHAVVMFGSPSGALHDPSNALPGGEIEEGWLLARLDVRLPIDEPYGEEHGTGSVVAILTAPDAESPLSAVEQVEAVAGRGLAGDRYHEARGTFSRPGGRGYELTLVEAESLDAIDLPWEQARRNIVTRGIALNPLVGRRFKVGEVECVGRRLAEPCAHLERLSRPGILRPLVHRAGLRADIVRGGSIAVGDEITVVA